MSPESTPSRQPVAAFCSELAAEPDPQGSPAAAGARAAALLAASGAALAARSQRGDPEADGAVYAQGRAEELDHLRDQALERLDAASELAARLARATDPEEHEKLARRRVEAALEAGELAVGALRIAAVAAPETRAESGVDLASAASLLAASSIAIAPEVRRSLAEVRDTEWAERHRLAAAVLRDEAEALLTEVHLETGREKS